MKKYIGSLVSVFFLVSFLSFGTAQASTLTSVQINAIVGLLQAFGANTTIVASVTAALNGTSAVTPTRTPTSIQPTVCPAWGCNYQPMPIATTSVPTLILPTNGEQDLAGKQMFISWTGGNTN